MIQAYPNYKNLGISWFDDVPEHWVRLPGRACFYEKKNPNTGLKEKTVLSLSYGRIVVKDIDKLHGLVPASFETYQIVDPSDIICRPTDLQNDWVSLRFGISNNRGIITSAYICLKTCDGVLPEYGYFLLHVYDLKKIFYGLGSGLRQNLDWRDFKYLPCFLPPLEEQKSILRFIKHINIVINRCIKTKQQVINLLIEQKQAVIHRAITRGINQSVSFKPSGVRWLGDIPKHWEVLPLGRLLAERKEKNDPIKTSNILSLSLHDGVIPYADKRPGGNKAKNDLTAYKLAYPGDIVLNSMNVVVGSVGLSKYFGAVSPVYYMLYPRHKRDVVGYFNAVFQDRVFQSNLFGLGNGIMVIQSRTTGKLNTIRMRIPMTKLNRVEFPRPSSEEQAAIVEYLARVSVPIDNAINCARREVDVLKEYRSRMVVDAVTGKIDVRDIKLTDLGEDVLQEPIDEHEISDEIEDSEEVVNADE